MKLSMLVAIFCLQFLGLAHASAESNVTSLLGLWHSHEPIQQNQFVTVTGSVRFAPGYVSMSSNCDFTTGEALQVSATTAASLNEKFISILQPSENVSNQNGKYCSVKLIPQNWSYKVINDLLILNVNGQVYSFDRVL